MSREAGVAPPLFIDRPLELEVVLLRGRLDLAEAYTRLPVDADPLDRRLLAWAIQAEELRDGGRHLHESALLTGAMAARLLAPSTVEEGLTRLARLEERGFLSKQRLGRRTVWTPTGHGRPVVRDGGKTTKFERAGLVTMAVHRLGGEATPAQIAEALGLGSTRTRSQWIGDAGDAELVEEIGKSTFDPNKVVRLTKAGRAHAAAAERRGGQP